MPPDNLPRPQLAPLQYVEGFVDDAQAPLDPGPGDIYRGEHSSSINTSRPGSTVSTSSSSSFLGGGRLGSLAAVVELAITRWARGKPMPSRASSTTPSPSSSRSSIATASRSQLFRRRKRHASISSLQTQTSEQDIAAHITRIKALQQLRQVPHEFTLYLPPDQRASLHLLAQAGLEYGSGPDRLFYSSSIFPVLSLLESALKKPMKPKRSGRDRTPHVTELCASATQPKTGSPDEHALNDRLLQRLRKGKFRDLGVSIAKGQPAVQRSAMPKAWFLDVSSPNWEDLRAIGKLLHLHPLTLEDILQQDPREKLELFPKLGYYFISFRAIESRITRETVNKKRRDNVDATPIKDDGPIGEANVYLTVFHDGICCFHYTDISGIYLFHRDLHLLSEQILAEHTERMRNRILLLEEAITMTSDWIAHGILDSIVDSFFPFLHEIEKEVAAIDELVFRGLVDHVAPDKKTQIEGAFSAVEQEVGKLQDSPLPSQTTANTSPGQEKTSLDKSFSNIDEEKVMNRTKVIVAQTRFTTPQLSMTLTVRRLKRAIISRWSSWVFNFNFSSAERTSKATYLTLLRMARTRKLVTSLGRLLATKSDLITQIRKRLVNVRLSGLGNGNGNTKGDEAEVSMYMGDVQDHILTLQHSLLHYERVLSQAHPSYILQLNTSNSRTRGVIDNAVLRLTIISMSVLAMQVVIGVFSQNIRIPTNNHSGKRYDVFAIILFTVALVLAVFLFVVRYWWTQAKKPAFRNY